MGELRVVVTTEALRSPDIPLMLRFAERIEPAPLNASATDQEFESNPQYENNPQGPTMRPWNTHTDGGRDINTDYHED